MQADLNYLDFSIHTLFRTHPNITDEWSDAKVALFPRQIIHDCFDAVAINSSQEEDVFPFY